MSDNVKFTEKRYVLVLIFVTSLFFLWAIALTMGDVLNKHFQNVLDVSKADSGLVQFSIFAAYALMGIPAGIFASKFGYKKGVLLGLILFSVGAFLFIPAANANTHKEAFNLFRVALFVLAMGLATLETVAHPFVAALGDERTSDQRVNFAQSFNGLGAIIGPLIGGFFIFKAGAGKDLESVKQLYTIIGIVVLGIAVLFAFVKIPPIKSPHELHNIADALSVIDKPLYKQRHFLWAVFAQFANIAAQAGTWAYFINYGVEKFHLPENKASYYFSLSMAMMMSGRFVGTYVMRFIAPNRLLAIATVCNTILCIIISQEYGWVSFVSLIMLNFFLSIMYPTIFSLGLKKLGKRVNQGSSILVMALFGGAVLPHFMGKVAETNVAHAYLLPIISYVIIFLFAIKFFKPKH